MGNPINKKKRLYDSVRWRRLRNMVLNEEPLCRLCSTINRITPSKIADHIIPHRDNPDLFWDRDNLQALCPTCHSGIKRVQENTGIMPGCDINGFPIDPNHPWGKGGSE